MTPSLNSSARVGIDETESFAMAGAPGAYSSMAELNLVLNKLEAIAIPTVLVYKWTVSNSKQRKRERKRTHPSDQLGEGDESGLLRDVSGVGAVGLHRDDGVLEDAADSDSENDSVKRGKGGIGQLDVEFNEGQCGKGTHWKPMSLEDDVCSVMV